MMSAKSEVFNPEIQSEVENGAEVTVDGDQSYNDLDNIADVTEVEELEEVPSADSNGYYIGKINFIVVSKKHTYKILEYLGQGGYGTVLKCSRMSMNDDKLVNIDHVAVKVARSGEHWAAWAKHELKMLRAVQSAKEFCIQPLDSFEYRDQQWISFELLDVSLYNYMDETELDKMPLAVIRRVVSDVLKGLAKLKDLGIVHADIKPENIMLTRDTYRSKLIDFGMAHYIINQLPNIQTLPFRAPENILQSMSGYGFPIDMWSLGCTMGEMLTYKTLYPGKCEYDMLRYIFDAQGLPEQDLIRFSRMKLSYFTNQNTDSWRLKTAAHFLADSSKRDELEKLVIYQRKDTIALDSIHNVNLPDLSGEEQAVERSDRKQFGNLLRKMLKMTPNGRIPPRAALRHPFITMTHLRQKRHLACVQRSYELMGRDIS